jgi:hypothetical protein
MKTVRGFVMGVVVALAIGGVAGAAPAIMHTVSSKTPVPTTSTVSSPKPPVPTTSSGDRHEGSDGGSNSGSSSTGLDNAIAHVSANLAAHPNKGLANALSHLQANKAKHEAHKSAPKSHASGS